MSMLKEAVVNIGIKRFLKVYTPKLKAMPKKTLAEIAGLGILAVPALAHVAGKEPSENTKATSEIAGLGILAAPEIHDFMVHLKGRHR